MTTQSHAIASDSHTYINELSKHVGAEVVLKGWLYNMRSSGKILFPQLRDGTGIVQCVVLKNAISPELWEALKALGQESALTIKGTVREDSRAPGGFEIDVTNAEVLQQVHDYPITPKEQAPVVALAPSACSAESQAHGCAGSEKLPRQRRLYTLRFADLHAGRL